MTVKDVRKDPEALTMTFVVELDAPVARAWELWNDPRQLERWWGPPTYPATFVDHDLTPGAVVTYFMTGPQGDRSHGWWSVSTVEAPSRLEFEDGFGESPNAETGLPTTSCTVTLRQQGDRTEMTISSTFPSLEAMEKVVEMGMEEGMTLALGQIDAILRDPA